ncbi:hypothetical protein SDRG_10826 [Saprolegnia diclina VS20]|uniref:Uncharacterized protein n=1 Tax=Saprolegnia diclina (strain VS20) TaxID=1156394 RepID=T0QAG0_SAPDV|nr:hypothetical protein SDRG_10826 [Saprolegnia diclina VS20]EQC31661.1 hypothetical protein SDRG_10826 [Saprolegnia diclina VS20]|eukprot:XP_008615060.1 hypothetical protein SDRG_10826 [Saprolegnia diclina VS20]
MGLGVDTSNSDNVTMASLTRVRFRLVADFDIGRGDDLPTNSSAATSPDATWSPAAIFDTDDNGDEMTDKRVPSR